MSESAVSVVIPTYNRAHLIERSIRSVLAAIEPGDEIVIVDDGSTDGTDSVLARFGDKIRVVKGPHRGCGAARNTGIDAARNPLIAFNDSDDEWDADKLRLQRAFMQVRPDVLFCFSDFGIKCDDGRQSDRGLIGWHKDTRAWTEILGPAASFSSIAGKPPDRPDFQVYIGDLYLTIIRANYVAAQTALVRRAWAGDAFRFSEDLKIHEDHECFARLARIGPAAYFDCQTFWQWGHDGPRVSRVDDLRWSVDRITLLRRVWGEDQRFLARHQRVYDRALSAERAALARTFLRSGRLQEAREELRMCVDAPLKLRLAASLPRFMLRGANTIRGMLRTGAVVLLVDSLSMPMELLEA